MAQFVSQSVAPSTSPRARSRTEYLLPLRGEITRIIRAYLDARPEGEDITLEVLRGLGEDALRGIAGSRDFDTVKKDVGLYVPIVLVDLYQAHNVLTYRDNDGTSVSTRSARGQPAWVNKYTPHRVLHSAQDRIVLDTNAVRSVLHGDPDALDLDALARLRGGHLVSIADPAWAELVRALLRGSIPFQVWSKRISEISAVLDPIMPIAPSGREAAAMSRMSDAPTIDFGHMTAYYRAVWKYVSEASSLADFDKKAIFETPRGERFAIGPLTLAKVEAVFGERSEIWTKFIGRLRVDDASRGPSIDAIAEDIRASLAVGMGLGSVDRLDLVIRVIARLAVNVNKKRNPTGPDDNDAIDLDVLFSTMLPAVICTSDKRMLSAAAGSESGSAWRVMPPSELIAWLSKPLLR